MRTDEFSNERFASKIRAIVGRMQNVLIREKGENYDERLIEDSIRTCVANALDRLEEDMLEMFTSPGRREFEELASVLERHRSVPDAVAEVEEMVHLAHE